MINRWGTAVLTLAIFATPLAAQEPSLESVEGVEEGVPAEPLPEESFEEFPEDFSVEPTVDVTELEASLGDLLPAASSPPPPIANILPANTPAAIINSGAVIGLPYASRYLPSHLAAYCG